jgi:uncharacterized phage protein (TIGR01671 family)
MREIKFRAFIKEYDIVVDVMSIGFREKLVAISDEDGVKISNDASCFQTEFVLDDVILLQYTGLKDKNGVEIYEGYIFYNDADNHIGVVSFINGAFVAESHLDAFEKQKLEPVDNRYFLAERLIRDFGNHLEVIGNIYQNKELLDER